MTTRDAGLTQEQVEAAEVHAAGSSHCGEIKSKSAFSRYSTIVRLCKCAFILPADDDKNHHQAIITGWEKRGWEGTRPF
jgi:hypothetical protein